MDMFARGLAPICQKAWDQIDEQAAVTLRTNLSARRFVDVKGPYGWERSCVGVGGFEAFQRFGDVGYGMHRCIRFVESRVDFALDVMELHNIERGSADPDLTPVEQAAYAAASFEDKMVYEGLRDCGIHGMKGGSELPGVNVVTNDGVPGFLRSIDSTVLDLETEHSINGPFAIVGGKAMRELLHRTEGGRTYMEILAKNTGAVEFIYASSLDTAYLVSKRGGDIELSLGGEFTVGYSGREGQKLNFFIAQSAAFRILEARSFVELHI